MNPDPATLLPGLLAWTNPLSRMSSTTRELVLVMGGLWLASMVVVIWALFFRSKRRHRSHHHHSARTPSPSSDAGETGDSRRRRRRRKRRSSEMPLNPTLAQTGGLPPLRSEKAPEPPA
jgi:hypothetical protein